MNARALTVLFATAVCAPPAPETNPISAAAVETAAPSESGYDEVLQGFVVLAPLAELFDAPSGTLRAQVTSSGAHETGTVRALGRSGEFIEIETLESHTSGSCRRAYVPILDARLRMWVHVDQLLPVVSRPLRLEFDDATAIAIDPGTPVELQDGVARGVWVGDQLVRAPIPATAVGSIFEPSATARSGSAQWMLPADIEPILNGRPLPTVIVERIQLGVIGKGGRERGPDASDIVELLKPQMLVYEWKPQRDKAIVELRSRCAVIEARIAHSDEPSPVPQSPASWNTIDDIDIWPVVEAGGERGRYRVRSDAAMYWSNGVAAGTASEFASFPAPGRELDGRTCFDVGLGPDASVCMNVEDLQFEPPMRNQN
jgi:hypothetical protein